MKRMPNTVSDVSRPLPPFERPPKQKSSKALALHAFFTVLAVGVIAGCSAGGSSVTPGGSHDRLGSNISRALPATSPTPAPANAIGCATGNGNGAGCHVKKNGAFAASSTPTGGLTAAQLRSAYGLPPAASTGTPSGPTIAIVDAFEDATAQSDLAKYRSQFGLPPCTSANGCFKKVVISNQDGNSQGQDNGGSSSGAANWSEEIALDLAMASASCPTCKLLLVETTAQDLDTLASAVNTAATYNPAAISVSWGVVENGNIANIDSGAQAAFNHPGIAITASTGDLGVVQFPASSPFVTAVGGTTLTQNASSARGWSETVWSSSGFGCSAMFGTPAWQTSSACTSGRATADVSMLADYNPGVAVYSSSDGGWIVLGGTSVGAPFVAGLYAQAGDYGAGTVGAPNLYANLGSLNPVGGAAGYTNGSPNGLAGF
jgi:subtilase family serine protease